MNLATVIEAHDAGPPGPAQPGEGGPPTASCATRSGGPGRGSWPGVEPGDRVAIVAANNWYFVVAYLAVLGAGRWPCRSTGQSCARADPRAGTVAARLALTGRTALAGWRAARRRGSPASRASCAVADLLEGEPGAADVARADDDLAVLLFTSGTVGAPAGDADPRQPAGQHPADPGQPGSAGRPGRHRPVRPPAVPRVRAQRAAGPGPGRRQLRGAAGAVRPRASLEAVVDHGVTVLTGVPTMWAAWAALPRTADPEAWPACARPCPGRRRSIPRSGGRCATATAST